MRLVLGVNPTCPLCPPIVLRARALGLRLETAYVVGSRGTLEEAAWQIAVRLAYPARYADYLAARWERGPHPLDTAEALGLSASIVRSLVAVGRGMAAEETAWWEAHKADDALPALLCLGADASGPGWFVGAECLEDYLRSKEEARV